MLIKEHPGTNTWGGEGSGRGQRGKLSCHTSPAAALVDPTGSPGARLALQSWATLGQDGQALTPGMDRSFEHLKIGLFVSLLLSYEFFI